MAEKHIVAITGGDTPLGRHLTQLLRKRGHRVLWYVTGQERKSDSSDATYLYNIEERWIDPQGLLEADTLIHLVGEDPWSWRWSKDKKYELLRSRLLPLALISRGLRELKLAKPPRLLLASSVAYYGAFTERQPLKEYEPMGVDFLAQVFGAVERHAQRISQRLGLELSILREGTPLYTGGGVFHFWSQVVRKGFNTPIGDGHQWMNWIHIRDLSEIYLALVEGKIPSGTYNAVAPSPVTNEQFMYALSNLYGDWIPKCRIPRWLVQLGMGEASTMLLEGSPVEVNRLIMEQVSFKYPTLGKAIRQLYFRSRKR